MELTSNHLDVLPVGHMGNNIDMEGGEETGKRGEKFGAPVSQSEFGTYCASTIGLFSIVSSLPRTRPSFNSKDPAGARNKSEVYRKKGM